MRLPALLDGVRTVVFVHAHPDDESLSTGALIAALASRGVAVDVVTATRGERGEVVPGPVSALEGTPALVEHRRGELAAALRVLGVRQHCFLGTPPARDAGSAPRVYRDSGMRWIRPGLAGPAEPDPSEEGGASLTAAPEAEEVADLLAWLSAHPADLVVSYDEIGGYGHPDHVRIQEVALAAAARAGVPFAHVVAEPGPGVQWCDLDEFLPVQLDALRCHASQMTVHGAQVVHSGGQTQDIVAGCGLRPAALRR